MPGSKSSRSSRSSSKSKFGARTRSKSKSPKSSKSSERVKTYNPFKRTATFLDNAVLEKLGIVTKGLDKFPGLPTLVTDLDALHCEDADLIFEIVCRNVQERPPLKSVNNIAQPFLPCIKDIHSGDTITLDDPERAAFILSQQFSVWTQKVNAVRSATLKSCIRSVKDMTFACEEDSSESESEELETKFGFSANLDPKLARGKALQTYEKCPFSQLNLLSSSCIQRCNSSQIAFSDHTGSVKICQNDIKQLQRLSDPHLSEFSKVYGFKTYNDLVVMRYRDGIAVVDDNGLMKSRILSSKSSFCDVTFLPFLDSILAVNEQGCLRLHNYEVGQDEWDLPLELNAKSFGWYLVDNHESSVFWARIASRKILCLFDVRRKSKLENLFMFDSGEICGGASASQHSVFQTYVSTNKKTILIDERYPKTAMSQWYHPNWNICEKVPGGITSQLFPATKYEYVLSYWPDGDVNLLVNDWSHSICPERLNSDTKVVLSCQKKPDVYPLSRGFPVMIPSSSFLRNQYIFGKESSYNRLSVPWTGLTTILSHDEKELQLVAVNAVGDVFKAILNHDPSLISEDRFHAPNGLIDDPFCDMDASMNVINEAPSNSEFDMLASEHISLPVDSHKLNWLKHKPLDRNAKEQLERWENGLQTFQKVSLATKLYSRDALPKIGKLKRSMNVAGENRSKVGKSNKPRYSVPRGKTPKEKSPFVNCPALFPAKLKNPAEIEGDDVIRVFNDEKPSFFTTDTEFSDTDSEFGEEDDFKSIKAKMREGKRTKHLPKGLPEDAGYTMEQFLQDLDPESNMTSTQQSQEDASTAIVQEAEKTFESSSFIGAHSRTSSKKKKTKRKKEAGF